MRKVIFEIAMSLDGFIEGPNGELDWVTDDDIITNSEIFPTGFDTIFFGRIAYERAEAHCLTLSNGSETAYGFHDSLSNTRKYVFSRTLKHVPGNGMVINNNLPEEVQRIRDEIGKDIWLYGGADILRTFVEFDLIDEYVLAVQPKILGSGKPLFKNLDNPPVLRHIKTQTLRSGVVLLHYQPINRTKKSHMQW